MASSRKRSSQELPSIDVLLEAQQIKPRTACTVSWAFSTVGDWMMNPLSTLHSLYCYCQQFTEIYMHRTIICKAMRLSLARLHEAVYVYRASPTPARCSASPVARFIALSVAT